MSLLQAFVLRPSTYRFQSGRVAPYLVCSQHAAAAIGGSVLRRGAYLHGMMLPTAGATEFRIQSMGSGSLALPQ